MDNFNTVAFAWKNIIKIDLRFLIDKILSFCL